MVAKTAQVIGAGISGPMAAITLANAGYFVTIHEARPATDLHSDGILGITEDNWQAMLNVDVELGQELPNTYTDANTGVTTQSDYHYIVWTDLHSALINRAIDLGIDIKYGSEVRQIADAGSLNHMVVKATGVGSAREVTHGTYTGYVVIRGLAYQFAGTPWTTLHGMVEGNQYLFNAGDTWDGASIEFFVKRDQAARRTTYSPTMPPEVAALPLRWQRLLESVDIWQTAPLSDWDVPPSLMDADNAVRVGDANGQLRPQTSMGANLALREARDVLGIYASRQTQAFHVEQRRAETKRGINIGIIRGKFAK